MATFYVSSGSGDDGDSGASKELAKKTLKGVLTGSSIADGDTVEILDEETYPEGDIPIDIPNLTIIHTASHLGRPKVDALGSTWVFKQNTSGTTFQGIEMYNASVVIDRTTNTPTGAGTWFHLTGCFIHDVNYLASYNIVGSAAKKTSIDECVLYFNDAGRSHINVVSNLTLRNSLMTASSDENLVADFGDATNSVTASFCTFINAPPRASSKVIIQVGKAINCIVSGSGYGIASDNHTYNLVTTSKLAFQTHDLSPGATGSGEITFQDPLFIDGTAVGSSSAIAANFKLQEGSPAVGYATPIGILFDLSGNARPEGGPSGSEANPDMGCFEYQYVPDPAWSSYGTQSSPGFDSNFTINLYQNLTSNYKLTYAGGPGQVPFSLGPKGPGTLRGRLGAYGVSKGGDPSTIIQTSSA